MPLATPTGELEVTTVGGLTGLGTDRGTVSASYASWQTLMAEMIMTLSAACWVKSGLV